MSKVASFLQISNSKCAIATTYKRHFKVPPQISTFNVASLSVFPVINYVAEEMQLTPVFDISWKPSWLINASTQMKQARVDIVPAAFIAIIPPPSQGQVPPNLQHSKGLLPKDFSLHFVLSVTLSSLSKSFALRPLTILFSSGPKNMVKKVRKMMVAEEEPCGRNLLGLFLNLSNGLPDFWLNREFQHLKRSKYQKYFCLYFCIKLACTKGLAPFTYTVKLWKSCAYWPP